MISLTSDEKVLMTIRRHWYVLVRPTILLAVFLVLPSLFFSVTGPGGTQWITPEFAPLVNFIFSIYTLSLLLYGLIIWADYYLDVWIITDKRLIDIQQISLFNRSISELGIDRVQDITIEINGFIPTLLKFGNLKVQTASESTFAIENAPNLYAAKEIILRLAQGMKNGVSHRE